VAGRSRSTLIRANNSLDRAAAGLRSVIDDMVPLVWVLLSSHHHGDIALRRGAEPHAAKGGEGVPSSMIVR